jgi:hypothetical protein
MVRWSEREGYQRCHGEERLFDKLVKNAENYERNMAEVEKQREQAQRSKEHSPLKGTNVILGG